MESMRSTRLLEKQFLLLLATTNKLETKYLSSVKQLSIIEFGN